MKSLSILLLLFAASQAVRIDKIKINDWGPRNPVTISQGGNLKLHCKSSGQEWDKCQFTHESNGKSCKINWSGKDSGFEFGMNTACSDSKMRLGGEINRNKCEVVVMDVNIDGDDGPWTCTLTKDNNDDKKTIPVELIKGDDSGRILDPKPSSQVNITKKTETSTLMGVRSAILAFTFLITAVFVAGCLVLLPKNWPLLRDQCCSWK